MNLPILELDFYGWPICRYRVEEGKMVAVETFRRVRPDREKVSTHSPLEIMRHCGSEHVLSR